MTLSNTFRQIYSLVSRHNEPLTGLLFFLAHLITIHIDLKIDNERGTKKEKGRMREEKRKSFRRRRWRRWQKRPNCQGSFKILLGHTTIQLFCYLSVANIWPEYLSEDDITIVMSSYFVLTFDTKSNWLAMWSNVVQMDIRIFTLALDTNYTYKNLINEWDTLI